MPHEQTSPKPASLIIPHEPPKVLLIARNL